MDNARAVWTVAASSDTDGHQIRLYGREDDHTATIAAVAFAAVLYKVVQSGVVQSALTAIIQSALHTL